MIVVIEEDHKERATWAEITRDKGETLAVANMLGSSQTRQERPSGPATPPSIPPLDSSTTTT